MEAKVGDFLKTLFNPGESICVSPNKYGYHSIAQEDLDKEIHLISPNPEKCPSVSISPNEINLVSINPVNGFRRDECVTAYRSFLVEIDTGPLTDQRKYIEEKGMPYSVCVFSGNKSLHYGIVLSEDLVSRYVWDFYCLWILNIMSVADQQTKNPSRSIRFPDNIRQGGLGLKQSLIDIKKRVNINDLIVWLNKFPDCQPKQAAKPIRDSGFIPSFHSIPKWTKDLLEASIDSERNNTWFKVAAVFADRGFEEDETVQILEQFYAEDRDFKRKEWLITIKSAFKCVVGA